MSNRWLSSGRYELNKGIFKRLWSPTAQLSEVIVPRISKRPPKPGVTDGRIFTEIGIAILVESGVELLVESNSPAP